MMQRLRMLPGRIENNGYCTDEAAIEGSNSLFGDAAEPLALFECCRGRNGKSSRRKFVAPIN
jgi:hypothetical protein